jgi:Winged helix-turn helix
MVRLWCGNDVPVAGLTHEQVLSLRTTAKETGTGVQGHSRSPVENAVALLTVNTLTQQLDLSFDAAVKIVAASHLASPSSIRASHATFTSTHSIPTPKTIHRGRGNPAHPLHISNTDAYGPSFEAELLIHRLVHSQKTEGVSITSTTIAAELREKLGIAIHRSTVRRWLHALGYRWRHKRYVGGMKPQSKNVRIRQFILEYAAALSEEEAGTAIIVYVDESYIHAHHASKKGWFHPKDRDVIGDRDGTRLIILHAMTENGLLAVPDTIASNWLNEPALTAELVFEEVLEDGQDDSDYHNTMTGAKFIAWVRNRLLPTFDEMYPGKKMYLVLDNAVYHKPRDETWIENSKAMNKHDLAHQLMDLGVTELITACGNVVSSYRFESKVSEGGPLKDDLIAATQLWLDQHPGYNRTVIEQLFDDVGHSLIYTPPFCPEVQPIELLWAKVKRYVSDRATHNRSVTEARQQTEEGFEQITKMFCSSIIKHCHEWIDSFLKTDAAEDLQQCGCLAKVVKNLSLLKIASTDSSPAHDAPVPMDIDPPASAIPAPSSSPARNLRKRR